MIITEPPIYQTATIINGLPTVTFSPRPYRRVITSVWVNSVVAATASLFRGVSQPVAVIDSTPFATPNTFTKPFDLPAGQLLFVVFSVAATPVNAAAAKITPVRSDSRA